MAARKKPTKAQTEAEESAGRRALLLDAFVALDEDLDAKAQDWEYQRWQDRLLKNAPLRNLSALMGLPGPEIYWMWVADRTLQGGSAVPQGWHRTDFGSRDLEMPCWREHLEQERADWEAGLLPPTMAMQGIMRKQKQERLMRRLRALDPTAEEGKPLLVTTLMRRRAWDTWKGTKGNTTASMDAELSALQDRGQVLPRKSPRLGLKRDHR
jgi:hypothetical protein